MPQTRLAAVCISMHRCSNWTTFLRSQRLWQTLLHNLRRRAEWKEKNVLFLMWLEPLTFRSTVQLITWPLQPIVAWYFFKSSQSMRRKGGWAGWHVATAPRAPAWDLKIHNHVYNSLNGRAMYVWVFSDAKVATKNTDYPCSSHCPVALRCPKMYCSM